MTSDSILATVSGLGPWGSLEPKKFILLGVYRWKLKIDDAVAGKLC
jgi:hypothetical protein